MAGDDPRPTDRWSEKFEGSPVFDRAALAIGMNEFLSRKLIWEAARASLVDARQLTVQDLGVMLPEIERLLRLVAPDELAAKALARVRNVILSWSEETR
jgi:hypothetical protein